MPPSAGTPSSRPWPRTGTTCCCGGSSRPDEPRSDMATAAAAPADSLAIPIDRAGRRARPLGRLWRDPLGRFRLGLVVLVVASAVGADLLIPLDPTAPYPRLPLQAPSAAHLFGTDHLRRDLLTPGPHRGR